MARSALLYFALVFAAGTVFGVIRTLAVEPLAGALLAVLFELPLMLAVSWVSLKLALRLRPVAALPLPRLGMGVAAFACLMAAEFLLARQFAGANMQSFLASLMRPEGLAGLSAQIVFGLMPLIETRIAARR